MSSWRGVGLFYDAIVGFYDSLMVFSAVIGFDLGLVYDCCTFLL